MPFIDRTILDFLLYDWLDAAALTKLPRFSEHSRETFDAVLDLSARVADDHFAPHAKKSDRNEPVFAGETVHVLPDIKAALQAYSEAGLFAATFDEALGGAQIPALIHTASTALTMAANIATAAYPMLTVANARLLASFGLPGQIETFARPLVEGRWFGTMVCLSRRLARRSPTSRHEQSPTASMPHSARATGCSATRCGFRAATMTWRTISSTWCSRRCPATMGASLRAWREYRCSSCLSGFPRQMASLATATTSP